MRKIVLAAALALAGCAIHHVPQTNIPMDPIPEFVAAGTVSLLNVQPSEERVYVSGRIYGVRREWTDAAIAITQRELTKRGLQVAPDAARVLKLSVESMEKDTGFVKQEVVVQLKVETGSGHVATYLGRNASFVMSSPQRQMDGAMMRVVAEMLKDPKLVSYLGGRSAAGK